MTEDAGPLYAKIIGYRWGKAERVLRRRPLDAVVHSERYEPVPDQQ